MTDMEMGQKNAMAKPVAESVAPPLDEKAVRLLEAHWGELKDQAYTTSLEDGWQINLRREGTLFSQIGFHNGDIIASKSLLDQTKETHQKALLERVLAIFEHLREV